MTISNTRSRIQGTLQNLTLMLGLALALFACGAAIRDLPYAPNPSRVSDPATTAARIIEANVSGPCVARLDVDETIGIHASRMSTSSGECRECWGSRSSAHLLSFH